MRYYSKKYPKIDDIVFVKYNRKTEQYSVIVDLIEYGLEGMIISSEISNRKTNVEKLFNNKIIPCMVLNVNEEKGFVDLSYKRVTEDDKTLYTSIYPTIEKIVTLGKEITQLYCIYNDYQLREEEYEKIYSDSIWKIFENNYGNFKNIEQLYEDLIKNPENIFKYSDKLSSVFINKSVDLFKKRIKITDIIVSNDFMLQILADNAIEKLKNILLTCIPENFSGIIKLECVSSPKYRLTITAKNENEVSTILSQIDEIIKQKIKNISSVYKLDSDYVVIKNKSFSLVPLKSLLNEF